MLRELIHDTRITILDLQFSNHNHRFTNYDSRPSILKSQPSIYELRFSTINSQITTIELRITILDLQFSNHNHRITNHDSRITPLIRALLSLINKHKMADFNKTANISAFNWVARRLTYRFRKN